MLPTASCRTSIYSLFINMAAAQPYLDLDCEEEQWEEQSEPYDEVSEASDADASPDSHINAETETDQDDPDSDTVSSGLCGGPEPPQDNLKLRFSAGTADLNGHGAVHEQLPAGEDGACKPHAAQLLPCHCPACVCSTLDADNTSASCLP